MPVENDNNLECEVRSIYAAIEKYEDTEEMSLFEKPSLKHSQSKRILVYVFLGTLTFFGAFSITVFLLDRPLEYIKLSFLLLLLVWYVVIPMLQIMELYAEKDELLQFFRNSNKMIIDGLSRTTTLDCLLAKTLKNYSIEALQLVKNRMSAQQTATVTRIGTLVGALEKVGIVPGLITLFLAASSKENVMVTIIVAIVVFILYLFAFTVHFSLPRFDFYSKLIESEIQNKVLTRD